MFRACWCFAAAAAALVLSGCVSFSYVGSKDAPNPGKVRIYADSAKITERYTVLGQATVSGNYQDVSRDRMMEKLVAEAKACGADAILLVEQQIVPASNPRPTPMFNTAYDYDDTNRSWSQLYRDVDQNFGSLRNRSNVTTAGQMNDFKRIIRAEFLKYTSDKSAETPKE